MLRMESSTLRIEHGVYEVISRLELIYEMYGVQKVPLLSHCSCHITSRHTNLVIEMQGSSLRVVLEDFESRLDPVCQQFEWGTIKKAAHVELIGCSPAYMEPPGSQKASHDIR